MRKALPILLFVVGVVIGLLPWRLCPKTEERVVTVIDTVTVTEIMHDTCYVSRLDTVWLHTTDTLNVTDTVRVVVPISTYHFQEHGLYDITASGFHLSIDSIKVFPKTEIRYVKDDRRWSIGIQIGLGMGKDGITPYVGIGANYKLINF